jgi:hypothetical protein
LYNTSSGGNFRVICYVALATERYGVSTGCKRIIVRNNWLYEAERNVNRIPGSRLPNSLTNYGPRCIRNQGRPLKRVVDE